MASIYNLELRQFNPYNWPTIMRGLFIQREPSGEPNPTRLTYHWLDCSRVGSRFPFLRATMIRYTNNQWRRLGCGLVKYLHVKIYTSTSVGQKEERRLC